MRKVLAWLLLLMIALYIISGFGITEYRVVETVTYGLLTKSLSFKIHDYLLIPFIVLFILHITLPYLTKQRSLKKIPHTFIISLN
jgi:hypothetical protein